MYPKRIKKNAMTDAVALQILPLPIRFLLTSIYKCHRFYTWEMN